MNSLKTSNNSLFLFLGENMEEGFYKTILLYTKLSPPAIHGVIPKIGRKKILEKLARLGIKENDLKKSPDGYYVWIGKDLLLQIIKRS